MARWLKPRSAKRTSSLPTDPAIEAVASGRSTTLDLGLVGLHSPELPDEIRRLDGLRELILPSRARTGSTTARLPPWLAELPHLERVDVGGSHLTGVPYLPRVRWAGLSAETLLRSADTVDPGSVESVLIEFEASVAAINHVIDLGRRGRLHLEELQIGYTLFVSDDRQAGKTRWQHLDFIDSHVDGFLESQPALQRLGLSSCPIGRVPETLRGLSRLDYVGLRGVWLEDVPDWLFRLPSLSTLSLAGNGLTDLPDAIGDAQGLTSLDLSYNNFRRIPQGIWRLSSLQRLDVARCPIEEIPSDILRLDALVDLEIGDPFRLSLTPASIDLPVQLVVPPPEIVVHGLDAIKRYWRQEQESGVDFLSEAKLLIVGEPGAGKTSLAKKIIDPSYELDSDEASTEGINVMPWRFPTVLRVPGPSSGQRILERDFRVNIWDFGGQEIYHSTHQFFLTKRSVYALVTDERKEDTDFEYWLEVVNLLSDASPIIIVQNRKQGRGQGVDLGTLRRRYPNMVGALIVDLANNSGLDDAVKKLRRELEQLPHIGTALPRTWRDVRLVLEADTRNYISADEFFEICKSKGFSERADMRQLGGFLHDLGICLYFQDDPVLSKTVILKPAWGTDAVYRLLDDPDIVRALGVFGPTDLRQTWHEPTFDGMHNELLRLMVKFGLCYPVPGSDRFIAPQLLSPSKPTYTWDKSDNLVLRYEYDVMPKGIVRRLIVALHDYIVPGDLVWRNGVVLEYDASRAEVVEEYRRRRLNIQLQGGDPRALLALIDHELRVIHRSYPGIKFDKYRPCDCEVCSTAPEPTMFAIRELEDFARTKDLIQCRLSRKLRNPVSLLAALYVNPGSAAAEPEHLQPAVQPEVFVSYRWGGDSEALVDEIQQRMTERGVLVTRDKNVVKYRDSVQQFMRRLSAGKCIVVILDKAYLQSKNCMYELTQIASRTEFASLVFPVVMPDAGIFDAVTRVGYVKYWEEQKARLDEAMKQVGQENLHGIREELDLYETIRNTIARIMDVLGDMNTLTVDTHQDTDFEALYQSLDAALTNHSVT